MLDILENVHHESANWELKGGECLLTVSIIARIVNTMALVYTAKKQDMNECTHFSFRRLWFVCKALVNSQMPLSVISFSLRLYNVREQQKRKRVKVVDKRLEATR